MRVTVVGGGLAGLAVAGALAQQGLQVTLLESRPRWGGRASSFVDQATGEVIDNCQHVVLGCCNNFQDLLNQAGCAHWLRREPVLWFVGPDGRVNRLAASPLPAPLHLAPAFARFSYFTLAEKNAIAQGLRSLARMSGRALAPGSSTGEARRNGAAPQEEPGASARPLTQSFLDWLIQHRQPQSVIDRFWHVVLVSALSETLDRIDVAHARKVFVDGFLRNRHGWEMWVPAVPLDTLYGEGLTGWLSQLGVTLRTQSGVKRVVVENGRAMGVELRSGETISADHIVLAVPHHLVLDLLPGVPELEPLRQFEDAPIASVHLWFDRRVVPLPHAVLVDRLSQWVFDRTVADTASVGRVERPDADRVGHGQYLQVVISASRQIEGRLQTDVVQQVIDELAAIWPEVRAARVTHSRVVTEHRAALSVVPGIEDLRPVQQSPIENVQLAGDWTRTGWPSTMEGAVRSGRLAAENILRQVGLPARVLAPEPPTAMLSRVLLGLR